MSIDRCCQPAARSLRLLVLLLLAGSALRPCTAQAGGGPLGIDVEWSRSDTGIWARPVQVGLEEAVPAVTALGALWLGNDDPLGHTFWQSADSVAFSAVAAQVLKFAFSRKRPFQGDDPNAWFQGHGYQSFPSGEVTEQAAFVTPFILDNYHDHPWIWALEALPLYDAIGRLKSQAHWQSDVLAGWVLGSGFGWWATTRETPVLVQVLPRGVSVGLYKRF